MPARTKKPTAMVTVFSPFAWFVLGPTLDCLLYRPIGYWMSYPLSKAQSHTTVTYRLLTTSHCLRL